MCQALEVFQEQHGVQIEKVTQIPLEGEGTISKRVDKCVHAQLFAYRYILKFLFSQVVHQSNGE